MRCHHFKLEQQKHDDMMYAYSDMDAGKNVVRNADICKNIIFQIEWNI